MNPRTLFAELKRRNVYQVAGRYAGVAWLLIQAASIVVPGFDAPPCVMKVFIIVVIVGFPVALIFSWAFEITPEGIKLESEIEPSKSIKQRTGRKIVAVTIALAVLAAGLFVYQLVGRDRWARRFNLETAEGGRPGGASIPADQKSIAVLPFVNMSADKNDEYLSDGMTEELINVLAKVPGLRVPGRSEEHTSELQSRPQLVCRLLLEKKKKRSRNNSPAPLAQVVPHANRRRVPTGRIEMLSLRERARAPRDPSPDAKASSFPTLGRAA